MTPADAPLPSDLAAAHAMILAERSARLEAEAIAARARAAATSADALIAHLKLEIEKLQRALYGSRSERKARLLEQMELQLEELESAATEDELASEKAAAQTQSVPVFARKRPVSKPFPEHLQRERVVIPAPCCCPSCGSAKLSKLGEDVTERRLLAAIRQASRLPPAPFHVTPRGFAGILQADACSGYNPLSDPARPQGVITSALCWSHARRQFFELADIAANARRGRQAPPISPIALEAVKRIDALFDIERSINGLSADERLRVRQEQCAPLVVALEAWLREERAGLSRSASVVKPIDYMLKRWDRFAAFLDDGRICLTNNAAERALRGFALGRKSWLFAVSERGADRAAAITTLIATTKLNDVDPLAWLADVLSRIADIPQTRLHELLPWEWKRLNLRMAA